MIKKSIEAVIFDMDGLMLDSGRFAKKAWQNAAATFGYTLSDEDILQFFGRTAVDSNKILFSLFGSKFPIEKFRSYARQLFSNYVKDDGVPIKPGLIELLDFLEKKNIATAVATSTSRHASIVHLDKCNLTQRFKCIVCGDDVPSGKPEPDLFLKAAELLQALPKSCIVLEDSFAGIRAAHSANMIPIMVPDLVEPTDDIKTIAHIIVPSLNEARLEIEKLLCN